MASKRTPNISRSGQAVKRSAKKKVAPRAKKAAKKATKKTAKKAVKAARKVAKVAPKVSKPKAVTRKPAPKPKLVKKVARKVAKKAAKKAARKVAKKAVKKAARKPVIATRAIARVQRPAKKTRKPAPAVKKTVRKAAKKTAKKVARKPAVATADRTSAKATRRPIPVTAQKKKKAVRKPAAKPKYQRRRLKRAEVHELERLLAVERQARIEAERKAEGLETALQHAENIITAGSRLRWKYVPHNKLPRAMGVDYETLTTGVTPTGFSLDPYPFESIHPGHITAMKKARMFGAAYARLPDEAKAQLNGQQAWLAQFYEAEQLNPEGNAMALVYWASKALGVHARALITFILSPSADEL